MPEIELITIYSDNYINTFKNLAQEQIWNIMFPEVLSPLQQELKSWYENLSTLHPKYMFILSKL